VNIRAQIPNLFTLANLACGSLAILFISQSENLWWCVALIGLAGFFDVLDGLAARALGVSGEMGKQLDSLADLVSFGVFPALLFYKTIYFYHDYLFMFVASPTEASLPVWLPYTGILLILAAAFRLARFNIDPNQSSEFKGLPAPANGLLWTSLLAAMLEKNFLGAAIMQEDMIKLAWWLFALVIFCSVIMVSRIRLFAFKFKDPSWRNNKPRWTFLLLLPAIVAITYLSTDLFFLSVPILLILYIVLSLVFNYLIPQHEVQSRN